MLKLRINPLVVSDLQEIKEDETPQLRRPGLSFF